MRKEFRSKAYQHLFCEIPFDIEERFANAPSDLPFFDHGAELDRLCELQSKLNAEYLRLMKEALTARQYRVLMLARENFTQPEIAKILGLCQSSVAKAMIGNQVYKGYGKGKRHGGAFKRLRAAERIDPVIQSIKAEIRELCAEIAE